MIIWTLLLATACGANEPAKTPVTDGVASNGATDTLINRVLSPEEARAYRLELKKAADMYSLDSYRESARQSRQETERQAAQDLRDAEGRAAASAHLREELTRKNLLRFRRPRKRIVLLNHYSTMRDIAQERQTEERAASAKTMQARRDSRRIEWQVNTIERATKTLAQVPIHAKYGQLKTMLCAFGEGVAAMPSAYSCLAATEDANLREEAAGGIEEAFGQALLAFDHSDPTVATCILARQDAALRAVLSSAAFGGLCVYVAEVWGTVKENTQLSTQQGLIAEYWLKKAANVTRELTAR